MASVDASGPSPIRRPDSSSPPFIMVNSKDGPDDFSEANPTSDQSQPSKFGPDGQTGLDLGSGSERLYLLYFEHVSVLQLSSTSREGRKKKGFRGFKKRMSGEDERKDEIKKRRREEEEGDRRKEGRGEGKKAALRSLKTTNLPAGR